MSAISATTIVKAAKALYEETSRAWTGIEWDWDTATNEVQQRFIKHIRDGSAPLFPTSPSADGMTTPFVPRSPD
jgi:hypothetical protein